MYKIVFVLFIVILLICIIYFNTEYTYTMSSVNNKWYFVKNGNKNSADTLALLDERINILLDYLHGFYMADKDYYYFVPILIDKCKNKYSILSEAAYNNRLTTYTVNKEEINVCLKTRDSNQKLYDLDLLMYVLLHELSHLCNYDKITKKPIIGHGDSFVKIFKILIHSAIKCNVYQYTDYAKNPQEYCGILLTSNVY